jgi:hypothetical protein
MKTSITFEVDTDKLPNYTDEYIAILWHVAQGNKAPFGDRDAGEVAAAVSYEIIARWLKQQPAPLYHHQQRDAFSKRLTDMQLPQSGALSDTQQQEVKP